MAGKKRILLLVLSAVLASSAVLKLFSLQYVTGVLFALLPVSWIDTLIASNLLTIVILASIFELLLALNLWTQWRKQSLYLLFGYLIIMLGLNTYQWMSGVTDCACFGSWLQVPVEITFFKTLVLIGVTVFLMNLHKDFDSKVLLIHKS